MFEVILKYDYVSQQANVEWSLASK